jgi:transposase
MKIIGCDFHPSYQQIAVLDLATGEMFEKALSHERKEEVRAFYAGLEGSARVGIEASGQSQWFERMLTELGHEVWIGDAAKIRASCERKQKTDRRDAELLLRLLAEDRFPRIWVPTAAERDDRQLLLHRHKLVRMRTQVKNQLQALALNQGVQPEAEAVEQDGKRAAGVVAAAALGQPAESGIAAVARSTGSVDCRTGPCGGRTGQCAASRTAIDDASRRGTDHGAGVHVDDGTRGAFPAGQTGGQLPGADSQRAFQRRAPAAPRAHQQTGQSISARVAGGSGAKCGAA